jgi:hypothetical protein
MSLAITNQMLKYVWLPEYRHDLEPRKNSLGWWERYIIKDEQPKRAAIGSFNVSK